MQVLLSFFNRFDGAFVGDKEVTLPHYFLPTTPKEKFVYIEPDESLLCIEPAFKHYDVVVELI